MPGPQNAARRLASLTAAAAALVLLSCIGEANPGIDPPTDQLQFPSGLLLDPRVSSAAQEPCETVADCGPEEQWSCAAGACRQKPRWLFVTNANSDLRFNGSAVLAVDLNLFFAKIDPGGVDLEGKKNKIAGPGGAVDDEQPCRFLSNKPQVVECREEPFIPSDKTITLGHFAATISAWDPDPDDGEAMLLIPVRGDPSVALIEIKGGLTSGDVDIDCGQGSNSGRRDPRRCADEHRLTHIRDDEALGRLGNEPSNVLVSPEHELAYVTHSADEDLSLISLTGLSGNGDPIVVDRVFMTPATGVFPGSFGIAERPCNEDDAPNVTNDCQRPMVYAAFRYQRFISTATVFSLDEDDLASGQSCIGPDDLGKEGGIICDAQYAPVFDFFAGGVSPGNAIGPPQLGDMQFSDNGEELFAVQTNPGALLRIDTSIDATGNTRDIPAGAVEVCPRATAMAIYRDDQDDYALVSCYRSAAIFVIDLRTLRVVANIQPGTGPHTLEVDLARQVVYVANTLEATVSVIDMARGSSSRFSETARIGLQDPYTSG
jgi:hypothetical protein